MRTFLFSRIAGRDPQGEKTANGSLSLTLTRSDYCSHCVKSISRRAEIDFERQQLEWVFFSDEIANFV
jgi:hypothetical protein